MRQLGVYEKDIRENFIKAGKKGGQKVNKTSTCVYLHHIPSGIEVKCLRERFQSINRFIARRLLIQKIERRLNNIIKEDKERFQKIRRQKRKRSKRAKEKVLKAKSIRSLKKKMRKKQIGPYE